MNWSTTFVSSLLSFLSVVVIAWITQRIIAYRERRKKIEETKLGIYVSWMPSIAEWSVEATSPTGAVDLRAFRKKRWEIMGMIQIMGPDEGIAAFDAFCDMAERGFQKDPSFNEAELKLALARLNYLFCCEIHGEKVRPELLAALDRAKAPPRGNDAAKTGLRVRPE